jgi:hypothetical protein
MTDHKATPSDWAWLEGNSTVDRCDAAWSRGLIELRARVEALEAAAQKHIVETRANILALASRVESLEVAEREASRVYQISKPLKLTPEQAQQVRDLLAPEPQRNYPAKPDSSLVNRVALAISGIEYGLERDEEAVNWASEARAAIKEVAAWLGDKATPGTPQWIAAAQLAEEANR